MSSQLMNKVDLLVPFRSLRENINSSQSLNSDAI